jgi:NAD(P)-dependent dehydrogenase (short-subunit alcohol dehydrogenase family)
MVAQIGADMGPIDILVNNAGIASRGQSVADTDPAEMERVVRVHAFGPFYLSKLVLPMMRELDRGDIVMISSVATDSYGAFGNPYNMGKAAMEALAFTLAKEEHRTNIVARPRWWKPTWAAAWSRPAQGSRTCGHWTPACPSAISANPRIFRIRCAIWSRI